MGTLSLVPLKIVAYVILMSRHKGEINQDLRKFTFGQNWILFPLIIGLLSEGDINEVLQNFLFIETLDFGPPENGTPYIILTPQQKELNFQ